MADIVTMPKLGFDMAEGTLVRWVAGEGDEIQKGAVLAEIETDKATVEVESSFDGTVRRHLVSEGDVVPVGDPIAIVGTPDESIDDIMPSAGKIAEAGESGPGAFTQGDLAAEEQPKVEQGTVRGVEPIPSEPGMEAGQGGQPGWEAAGAELKEQPPEIKPPDVDGLPDGVRASPVARRMAAEKGIDLRQVRGSGPGGRIVRKDVETFRPEAAPAAPAPAAPAAPAPAAPEKPKPQPIAPPIAMLSPTEPPPPDKEIPLSRLRAAVGKRMVQSKQQAPHFYITHEYDMGPLMELRKQINALVDESEKVSVNDLLVKAVALTLRQFPNLNATFEGDKIVHHGQVNVSVAVAVEGGLLVVVVPDTDRKPVRLISKELKEKAARAREGKVRPDDVEGSTFSTSNLGMFDVENFAAVLNPPEAGIIAFGSAREVPVVVDGEIKVGLRMKATVSVDHRTSDGAEGARFMQALAKYIEAPMSLLM